MPFLRGKFAKVERWSIGKNAVFSSGQVCFYCCSQYSYINNIKNISMTNRNIKANKAIFSGFFVNIILVALKMIAGIVGHSSAIIADAFHSLSDFLTDIIVLWRFRAANKPGDKEHQYGHGKIETLAALIIGIFLFWVGARIL